MNSSKILKSIRGQRLKTQDDIAKNIGVSRQVYCGYENNPLQCELNILFEILRSMDASKPEIADFSNAIIQDYLSYFENKK